MWPDGITLNRESRLDGNTNDGSIYTGGSHHSVDGATTRIYIFHRRTDDIPLTQLGEIRSWIEDGQGRLQNLPAIRGHVSRRRTFTTCPAAGAFENDAWRLIWQCLPTCLRWKNMGNLGELTINLRSEESREHHQSVKERDATSKKDTRLRRV
ncbi:hypothetical protein B0H13DRAFT_2289588 [Mycena leptocephala]|nr:hypothetical protein B0H13DRAFT_2289588 [Mycena leptocephala]